MTGLAIDSCKMNREIEAEGETEERRGRSETERRGDEKRHYGGRRDGGQESR